jgi:hypothetical protein
LTVPFRPDGPPSSWLSKYFADLQHTGTPAAADGTAVANSLPAAPAAPQPLPLPKYAQYAQPVGGMLGHVLAAGEQVHNFLKRTVADPAQSALSAAKAMSPWDVTQQALDGLSHGSVAGLAAAVPFMMPGGEEGEAALKPAAEAAIGAPNINLMKEWKPTPRGIFDRSAPSIQGQIESDPRLVVPAAGKRSTTSPLVDAVANSKTVRRGLDADVDKGLLMGGPGWYELGPVKADLDSRAGTGAMSFSDFNNLGGASSASNSVPGELSAMTVANYARIHGLSREEAVQHFLQQTGSRTKPSMMDSHLSLGLTGIRDGTVLPSDPASESWKIPSYVDKRNGGGGLLSTDAPGGMPALDTHERRRIMQLVMENPRLAKIAREQGADVAAEAAKGVLPLRNALDYKTIAELYNDGAKRYGLPTSGAYQASRWTGGWDKTGLKTAPRGDFVQLLEDAIKFSAQQRSMDDSPAGLRAYWKRVAEGKDFIMPFAGKGYYPLK